MSAAGRCSGRPFLRENPRMAWLILGLLLFLGTHSTRVFAEGWRTATIARIGEGPWKGLYTVLSIAGFVLLVWGYAQARQQMPLWDPKRDRAAGKVYPAGTMQGTIVSVVVGLAIYAAFVFGLHTWLIGVRPV